MARAGKPYPALAGLLRFIFSCEGAHTPQIHLLQRTLQHLRLSQQYIILSPSLTLPRLKSWVLWQTVQQLFNAKRLCPQPNNLIFFAALISLSCSHLQHSHIQFRMSTIISKYFINRNYFHFAVMVFHQCSPIFNPITCIPIFIATHCPV